MTEPEEPNTLPKRTIDITVDVLLDSAASDMPFGQTFGCAHIGGANSFIGSISVNDSQFLFSAALSTF